MPFDLSTAKPIQAGGGFDLSTAKPVSDQPALGVVESGGHRYGRMTPKEDQSGQSFGHQLIRAMAIPARAGLEGIASLPAAALDLAAYPVNLASRLATGHDALDSYQQLFKQGLTELGGHLPGGDALSAMENVSAAVTRGAAAAMGGPAVGESLAALSNPVAAGVGNTLQSAPAIQTAAGAGGSAGSELARQAGGGPVAQLAANVAGSLAGGAGAAAALPAAISTLPAGAATTAADAAALRQVDSAEAVAQQGAHNIGLDWNSLDDNLKTLMTKNAKEAIQTGAELGPDALARKSVYESLGIRPTKALITRRFEDALNEQNLLKQPEAQALRNIYIQNNQAIQRQITSLIPEGVQTVDNPTFGARMRAPLLAGERNAQGLANNAYDTAMQAEGGNQTSIQPVVDYLQENAPLLGSMEKTKPVVAYLKQIGAISDKNMSPIGGMDSGLLGDQGIETGEQIGNAMKQGTGYNALPISLKELSKLRTIVNRSWMSAKNSGDDAAAAPLNDIRGLINDAETSAGGELFKSYRYIRGLKGAKYEDNPLIDQLLSDKRGYPGTPQIEDSQVFNTAVINSSPEQFAIVWPRLRPQARDLTRAQVAQFINDRAFSNMGTNEAGDVVASAAKLNQALNGIGPQKLRLIFGQKDSETLSRLNTAVREISNPPSGTVPAGSAPMLNYLYRNTLKLLKLSNKIPGLNVVADVAERRAASETNRAATEAAITPLQPLQPNVVAPDYTAQFLAPIITNLGGAQQ